MIFGYNAFINKRFYFKDIEEACNKSKLTPGRILNLIKSGKKWKGWIFDEF